jgi:DnaD/phage-associated family protein
MKIKFNYSNGVLNLPADVVGVLTRADSDALRVLITLGAMGAGEIDLSEVSRLSGCDDAALERALAFWRGTGLIEADQPSAAKTPVKKRKKTTSADQAASTPQLPDEAKQATARTDAYPEVVVKNSATALPAYTTEELTAVLERRRELTALIDECSRVFGKIFNTHEVSQLIGLADYLGLEGEYLLLLLAHCRKIGKKSLRYAIQTAVSLYDEGVTETAMLQQSLKAREERLEMEGQLRSMFGIGSRALTSKEKKAFDAWVLTHGFSMEVIRMAYERTIHATNKPSVAYTNSILERWVSQQLRTPEQIHAAEEAYANRNQNATALGNSFDTDDFFQAALRRSYGEDYLPADQSKSKGDDK